MVTLLFFHLYRLFPSQSLIKTMKVCSPYCISHYLLQHSDNKILISSVDNSFKHENQVISKAVASLTSSCLEWTPLYVPDTLFQCKRLKPKLVIIFKHSLPTSQKAQHFFIKKMLCNHATAHVHLAHDTTHHTFGLYML